MPKENETAPPYWMREWIKNIQKDQDNIRDCLSELKTQIGNLRVVVAREIAALKVKAGVWGALAGLVPVVIGLLILLIAKAN